MKTQIRLNINMKVLEYNEHYCILAYDNDRKIKLYSFEPEYKLIKRLCDDTEK
jgi:hypothetical protein